MNKIKYFQTGTIAVLIMLVSSFASAAVNPQPGWADSYSVGGKCYCATTFDHGIGGYTVDTPAGRKTVREVCNRIGRGPGKGNNPVYNTVQCGHEPAHNDAAVRDTNGNLIRDEKVCPGRVDQGAGGCNRKGPRWDLSVFGNTGGGNGNGNSSGTYSCENNNNQSAQCKNDTGNRGAWCNIWNNGKPKNVCHCGGRGPCRR